MHASAIEATIARADGDDASEATEDERARSSRDFRWALGLNQLSLQLMGVWPNERELSAEAPSVALRVPAMVVTVFVCLFLPQMYALALVIRELPLVIDNLMTSCAALTSCIKLYFIWRNKRVLWPVVESVTQDWLRRPRQPWQLRAMKREAARARLFTVSGYAVLAGCYAGFAFAPLFGINIRMVSNLTDYGDRLLLVQSYLPYDYSRSPSYELTQAAQLLAGLFVGMAVSIPDNYFAALVFHVSAQFEILGGRIERFAATRTPRPGERNFQRSVGALIRRHVHLMAMVRAIEESFNLVIVAQVLCMSLMVCCLGFQIIGMLGGSSDRPSSLQVITLVATLFTWMMHALVNCFASETLAFRSSGLFHNIYNCEWYNVRQGDPRLFVPMMLLAKAPSKLTAGKVMRLSLPTYCKILKSSAGYISMLIAVNGK